MPPPPGNGNPNAGGSKEEEPPDSFRKFYLKITKAYLKTKVPGIAYAALLIASLYLALVLALCSFILFFLR